MSDSKINTTGLTPEVASNICSNGQTTPKEVKKVISENLQRALNNGEITQEETKAARKFLDGDIMKALARQTKVMDNVRLNDDLEDPKADKLMKEAGLTVEDLYNASKLAGLDYEVSYTKLSKEEKAMAENGEITSSELKNIQNTLNEKIKANGGDKVLNDKETKQLMKGLGLSVEKKFNIPKIIISALGLGDVGALVAGLTYKGAQTVTTTAILNGVEASTTAHISAKGIGFAGGAGIGIVVGAGAEMLHQANRKEKAYGEQDGVAGGQGSVTNKTEAKMHKIDTLRNEFFIKAQHDTTNTTDTVKTDEVTTEEMHDGSILTRRNGEFESRTKKVKGDTFDVTDEEEMHFLNEAGETIAKAVPVLEKDGDGELITSEYYDGKGNKITEDEFYEIISKH